MTTCAESATAPPRDARQRERMHVRNTENLNGCGDAPDRQVYCVLSHVRKSGSFDHALSKIICKDSGGPTGRGRLLAAFPGQRPLTPSLSWAIVGRPSGAKPAGRGYARPLRWAEGPRTFSTDSGPSGFLMIEIHSALMVERTRISPGSTTNSAGTAETAFSSSRLVRSISTQG